MSKKVSSPVASLSSFTIYNRSLKAVPNPGSSKGKAREREGSTEDAQVLLYISKDSKSTKEKRLRAIGLGQGVADFARMLNPVVNNVQIIQSDAQRLIFVEPEPGYIFHAIIELPYISSPDTTSRIHQNRGIEDSTLISMLDQGYREYRLLNGSLDWRLNIKGRRSLESCLQKFFTVWVWRWDVDRTPLGFLDSLSAVPEDPEASQENLFHLLSNFEATSGSEAYPILLRGHNVLYRPKLEQSSGYDQDDIIAPSTSTEVNIEGNIDVDPEFDRQPSSNSESLDEVPPHLAQLMRPPVTDEDDLDATIRARTRTRPALPVSSSIVFTPDDLTSLISYMLTLLRGSESYEDGAGAATLPLPKLSKSQSHLATEVNRSKTERPYNNLRRRSSDNMQTLGTGSSRWSTLGLGMGGLGQYFTRPSATSPIPPASPAIASAPIKVKRVTIPGMEKGIDVAERREEGWMNRSISLGLPHVHMPSMSIPSVPIPSMSIPSVSMPWWNSTSPTTNLNADEQTMAEDGEREQEGEGEETPTNTVPSQVPSQDCSLDNELPTEGSSKYLDNQLTKDSQLDMNVQVTNIEEAKAEKFESTVSGEKEEDSSSTRIMLSPENNVASLLKDAVRTDMDPVLPPIPHYREIKIYTGSGVQIPNEDAGVMTDVLWLRRGDLTLILVLRSSTRNPHLLLRCSRLLEGLEVILSPSTAIPPVPTSTRHVTYSPTLSSYRTFSSYPSSLSNLSSRQRNNEIDINTFWSDISANFAKNVKESLFQTGNGGWIGGRKEEGNQLYVAVGKGVASGLVEVDVEIRKLSAV